MNLLIIVTTPRSGPIAAALGKAALRANITWAVFFTNDGVTTLSDLEFVETILGANKAVACTESWQLHMGDAACPVEEGSQTNDSALVGEAEHIVSL